MNHPKSGDGPVLYLRIVYGILGRYKQQEAEPFDCQLEYPLDTDEGFAEEVL